VIINWVNVQLCQFAEFTDGVECGVSYAAM